MNQDPIERRFRRLAVGANRKAERVGSKGILTDRDLFDAYRAAEGRCPYCEIELDPMSCSFDHVLPFDRGGRNDRSNLQACCLSCQRRKFTKTPEEYAQWQTLERTCPCGVVFRPRWSDYRRGFGFYHSRICSGSAGGTMKAANASRWR